MSRAFVREIDDAPPEPLADRQISDAPNFVTPEGAVKIERLVEEIERDIAKGPLPEAAALLRRDLRYWLARRATMQVRTREANAVVVGFGAQVTIRHRDGRMSTYRIVGEDEANPGQGLLSWVAPLARALEGARAGEVVEAPAGEITVVLIA